jgi:hypothetical protein
MLIITHKYVRWTPYVLQTIEKIEQNGSPVLLEPSQRLATWGPFGRSARKNSRLSANLRQNFGDRRYPAKKLWNMISIR